MLRTKVALFRIRLVNLTKSLKTDVVTQPILHQGGRRLQPFHLLLSLSSEPERLLSLVLLVRGAPTDAPNASVIDLPLDSTAEDDVLTPTQSITRL